MADGEQDRSSTVPRLHPVPLLDEGAGGGTIDEPEEPDLASLIERGYLIAIGLTSLTAGCSSTPSRARSTRASSARHGRSIDAPSGPGRSCPLRGHDNGCRGGESRNDGRPDDERPCVGRRGLPHRGGLVAAVAGRLSGVDERGQRERIDAEDVAGGFADVLLPAVVEVVVDRIDLTAIVVDRVDLDAVVERLDVDRIVDRVDLQRAIDRISINEIVAMRPGPGGPPGRRRSNRRRGHRSRRHR